jgi:hypothetical protein
MNKYEVSISETNSGGYYNLTNRDYDRLERDGWDVDRSSTFAMRQHGVPESASLRLLATSEEEAEDRAVKIWEGITGEWINNPGCSCCGPRFSVWTDKLDYPWVEEFEDAVREALQYAYGATELTDIVERVAYE